MVIEKIVKRDGRVVNFDISRIANAIFKAARAVGGEDYELARRLARQVVSILETQLQPGQIPTVEQVQDIVEKVLVENGHYKTAKAYILYRRQHEEIRKVRELFSNIELVDNYIGKTDWRVRENSNMTYSLQGLNFHISSVVASQYWLEKIYPPEIREAHLNGDLHIHDLGILGPYCVGWDLRDLLLSGFRGVRGKITSSPPKHFRSALGQLVNFLYTLQGEAAGAQAVSNLDTLLAPFIRNDKLDYKAVKQALQEFIFNLNVPTRVGFQTPFSNCTLDLKVPEFMRDELVIVGGEVLDATYGEFQEEMEIFNEAFAEVMLEGDADGRAFTFPIPTYNITPDFDWENPRYEKIWLITAKYGIPYFSNFINSDMKPEDVRSMCCRLRIDNTELRRRGGGLFGANPLTGSIGVVTINMPRLGYLARNEEEFFNRLDELMYLAKESLEIKREVLERFTEKGLYPYSKFYLREIKAAFGEYWKNHFSTIGLVGMNECCLNLFGRDIGSEIGRNFAVKVLDHMRERLSLFQEETGNIYNLEATPAEGASYRLAKEDKARFPNIITAGTPQTPYYTNCLSSDTEVLTKEGWRTYDRLKIGDEVLTYNLLTGTLEYQRIRDIYIYDGEWEMVNIRSKTQDQLVTLNHMVLFESEALEGFELLAPAAYLPESGFAVRMGASWHIQEDNQRYPDELLKKIVHEEVPPQHLLNSLSERQLNLLLIESARSNGIIRDGNPIRIYADSPELADRYQEIAIKTNKRCLVGCSAGMYHVDFVNSRQRNWIIDPPKRISYRGIIWCIEVPNHTFVARRNGKPFITGNSTHLPVNYTDDLFEALRLQEPLQTRYTGGTVFHIFIGEKLPPAESVKALVRKVCENFRIPYFTITPTFSICPTHGYIFGEHTLCPKCLRKGKRTECEVYSRVVGYLRPVDQWNDGKQAEFMNRNPFRL